MEPGGKRIAPPADGSRALRDLIDESRALRCDVKVDAARRRTESLVTMAAAIVVLVLIALVLAVGWQNRMIGRQNAEISHQIADCTTAGGRCYEQGQERTGEAVAELTRMQMLIEVCGRDPGVGTLAEMRRCVAEGAARGG